MRKVVPTPTSLSTAIVPPCASTIDFAIDSPRPVPLTVSAVEARKKRSKTLAASSCGMPTPVSLTSRWAVSPWLDTVTRTVPPGRVNLIAFESRLSSVWPRRIGSAQMAGGSSRTSR
jgi:hypothetical protein